MLKHAVASGTEIFKRDLREITKGNLYQEVKNGNDLCHIDSIGTFFNHNVESDKHGEDIISFYIESTSDADFLENAVRP